MSSGDWRPSPVDDVEVNEVADGLVIYRPASGDVHYLNNTAAAVFVLCTGERSVGDIIDGLTESFALEHAPAGDVVRCIDRLIDGGLVQ